MTATHQKPCPFCGSTNIMLFPQNGDLYDPDQRGDRTFPIARCLGCFAEAAGEDHDGKSRHARGIRSTETAAKAWNRRVEVQS